MGVVSQEAKRLAFRVGFRRSGGWKSLVVHLLVIGAFGVFYPWRRGFDFLDAFIILAYAGLSMLFAAPAMVAAMAVEAPGSMRDLLARIVTSVAYGWGMSVILIATGLITLNAAVRPDEFLHPRWSFLAAALSFGLGTSLFLSASAALVTMLFSSTAATMFVRVVFLAVLCLVVFRDVMLPEFVNNWFARQMTTEGLTRLAWLGGGGFGALGIGLVITLRAPFLK
jgi:hypothetical protein